MPKINVYLPDDLAAQVRDAGIPVSPVCQAALAEAVRQVGRARKAADAIRSPSTDAATLQQIGDRLEARATLRLREALRLATPASGPVETVDLLLGLLDEGHNVAIEALRLQDVDLEELRLAVAGFECGGESAPADLGNPPVPKSVWPALTQEAREAIAAALEASVELGHNYLGCEHLLLGLLGGSGAAAQILTDLGAGAAGTRRAVAAVVAGAGAGGSGRGAASATEARLDEITRRLEAVERQLGAP